MKYHQGMPFCAVSTAVSAWYMAGSSATTARDLVRLHAEDDQVLRPGLGDPVRGPETHHDLAAVLAISFRPSARIAARCAPRAISVTLVSRLRQLDAEQAADRSGADDADLHSGLPSIRNRVAQRADAVDAHFDDAAGPHRQDAQGGAAGDHVARLERHLAGNQADDPAGGRIMSLAG